MINKTGTLSLRHSMEVAGLVGALALLILAAVFISEGGLERAGTSAAWQDFSVPAGAVTAISSDSISIQPVGAARKTFSIGPSTRVISRVAYGETGVTLAQIPLQAQVLVVPDHADPARAASINLLPPPPVSQEGVALVSAQGTVASKTAAGMTLKKDDGSMVMVRVNASTKVLSNVTAGEKGAGLDSLEAGDQAGAIGTPNAEGGIDAREVLILRPVAAAQ
jgi:hypothetical protein